MFAIILLLLTVSGTLLMSFGLALLFTTLHCRRGFRENYRLIPTTGQNYKVTRGASEEIIRIDEELTQKPVKPTWVTIELSQPHEDANYYDIVFPDLGPELGAPPQPPYPLAESEYACVDSCIDTQWDLDRDFQARFGGRTFIGKQHTSATRGFTVYVEEDDQIVAWVYEYTPEKDGLTHYQICVSSDLTIEEKQLIFIMTRLYDSLELDEVPEPSKLTPILLIIFGVICFILAILILYFRNRYMRR